MSSEIDSHSIYVDQLRDGKVERLDCAFSSELMDVNDESLTFKDRVQAEGEAYISDQSLILHLDLRATAVMPCTICNEPVETKVLVRGVYHVVPMEEIKGHVFDIRGVVRENILLNTPSFSECGEGNCKERQSFGKYLKSDQDLEQEPFEGQQPFKDL